MSAPRDVAARAQAGPPTSGAALPSTLAGQEPNPELRDGDIVVVKESFF